MAGDGFKGARLGEKARAPAGQWFDIRAVIEPARAPATVVAEIRASATSLAAVRATTLVIARRAAGTGAGTAISGRSAKAWATVILTRAAWAITTGRTIRARSTGTVRPGPAGSAKTSGSAGSAGTGTAIFHAGTTRAIRAGAPRRAAGAVEILTGSETSSIAARAFATTTATASITLTLTTPAGFAFAIGSTAPNDFAGRGFALLQIPYPIRGEVQILQLREVDGFWI